MREEDYPLSTPIRNIVAMQIKFPNTDPATGAPGMPAHLVKGSDVDDVAASYVACAAGIPVNAAVAAGCGPQARAPAEAAVVGGGNSTDGKAIFSSAGCVSCHTLKAAGATGKVGPNLDQSKIDEAGAIKQVTNGGGVNPGLQDSALRRADQGRRALRRHLTRQIGRGEPSLPGRKPRRAKSRLIRQSAVAVESRHGAAGLSTVTRRSPACLGGSHVARSRV